MSETLFLREEIHIKGKIFSGLGLELKNASLLILSEGENKLGTLVVALPHRKKMITPSLSSILLGDRNMIVARLIAERLSERTKKMTLVSVFTKTISEKEAVQIFLKLVEKIVGKVKDEK